MYYNREIKELAQEFSTDLKSGLTEQQVTENLAKYGPNELEQTKKQSIIVRFFLQFKDALTIILIIAAVVSIIVEPTEWIDSAIIVFVVVVNAILGLVQENNAERALEALQKMASPKAKVIREGNIITINASQVVPGDLLVLEAGDCIASDGRLVECFNLKVDESALTGESVPVEKISSILDKEEVPLAERNNMVYASCNVTYGRGIAIVTTTGEENEVGKIATMIQQTKRENTPLQDQLDQIGRTIGVICIIICIVVFGMELLEGLSILEAFKTSIALAVAAIPEGLATVVTVVLALSVQRMVKKNAIVKSLPAVETLGSTSIVCSDKTGTLTQNKMTVVKTYLYNRKIELLETCSEETNQLLNYFTLCSDGSISTVAGKEVAVGDPTETALVKASLEKGFTKDGLAELYDVIFARCNNLDIDEVSVVNETMSNEALRVLALGIRYWDEEPQEFTSEMIENNLTFIGMVGMIDPPREEAKQAVAEAKSAGVRTIMITGDHVITASAIARSLGILESGQKAIMGSELAKMSDQELAEHIEEYSVYARVAPEHKVRIVNAWKSKGKVVAMTGDGVNDSPALKAADIGCAMGITGTDVAKGAASMILTDDNFATIITSIREGRGIFDNIKKDVQFLLSSNIGEVLTIFGASLISLLTPHNFGVPLLPIHLLWVNLITDSLPAFALGMEPTEPTVMHRKPRQKDEGFFSHGLGFTIAWQGLMIGTLTLIAYAIGNNQDHTVGMTMAFITLCGCQLVHSFNVKSSASILNRTLFNNPYLWGALAAGLLLQVIILAIPELSAIFKLQPLNIVQWGICVGLCLSTTVICELVKFFDRRKNNPS